MCSDNREWTELITDISTSPAFRRAPLRTELLKYFFRQIHKPGGVSRKTLALEVFESARYDEGAVGERCLDLRTALKQYAESRQGVVQKWRCELPPASPSEGYKLRFINQASASGATGAFWQAHLSPARDVLVVYNEPLFYRHKQTRTITRHIDINNDHTHTDTDAVLTELQSKRPEFYRDETHPSFLYLLSGEIAARDYIQEWFAANAGVKALGRIGRRTTSREIAESSPVLLGNLRTNTFMRTLLESPHCENLAYALHPSQLGTIMIRNPTPDELTRTGNHKDRMIEDGVLFLNTDWQANQDVFGVVTRLPNPYQGEGAITMVTSDYSRAVEEIAHVLTDEQRFAPMAAQLGWSSVLPACFQCLFEVRLGPVNIDTEARPAKLVVARSYEQ
jgi:hypothetical protein